MAGMNIQYPNIDPWSKFSEGVVTGAQLGSMYKKKQGDKQNQSDAIIPDPGERPQVNPADALSQESKEMGLYEKYYKKTKKLSPEARKSVYNKLIKSGQIKSGIVQSIMLNDDIINPEDAMDAFKKIRNNDPTASADIEMLVQEIGGDEGWNSPFGTSIKSKESEIKKAQSQLDKAYVEKLKKTVTNVDEVLENPKAYQGKSGIMNEQTAKVVQNQLNYIAQLMQLDPEWAKQYLQQQQTKRSGGKPRQVEFSGYTKDKKRVIGTFGTVQAFMRANPDVIPGTVRQSERESFLHEATGGGLNVDQQINVEGKTSKDQYTTGKVYEDANGNKAKYLGNGKWQPM